MSRLFLVLRSLPYMILCFVFAILYLVGVLVFLEVIVFFNCDWLLEVLSLYCEK